MVVLYGKNDAHAKHPEYSTLSVLSVLKAVGREDKRSSWRRRNSVLQQHNGFILTTRIRSATS